MQQLSAPTSGALSKPIQPKWRRPPDGVFKLNWDAALHRASHYMGLGIIVHDAEGLVLASKCSKYPFITDPTIAAWKTAEFCHELGLQRVILEGDVLVIVQALRQKEPTWSSYGQLIEDTCALLNGLPFWMATHTRREANEAAHQLA